MLLRCGFLPLVFLMIVAVFRVPMLAAEPRPSTNFELVQEAARGASAKLVARLDSAAVGSPVALHAVGTHEGGFLVESTLSSVLTAAGHAVRTRADSTAGGPVLEFEVMDLGVAYTRVWRNAWLGDKKVERQARARVFARLVDDTAARILWAEQAEAKVVDEVAYGVLPTLEEKGGATYLQATLPTRSWNKIVEPLVVTGIVAGLILLFFSNQDVSN